MKAKPESMEKQISDLRDHISSISNAQTDLDRIAFNVLDFNKYFSSAHINNDIRTIKRALILAQTTLWNKLNELMEIKLPSENPFRNYVDKYYHDIEIDKKNKAKKK